MNTINEVETPVLQVKIRHQEVYERLERLRKHKRKIRFLTLESFNSISGCVKCQ